MIFSLTTFIFRICRITSRHGHSAWTPYWQLISRLYFRYNMNVLPGALRSVFARRAGLRRPASDGRWCPRPGPSTLSARSVCWAAGSIGQRSSQACSCANQTSTRYSNESGRVQSPDGAATAPPAPPCPPGYRVYPHNSLYQCWRPSIIGFFHCRPNVYLPHDHRKMLSYTGASVWYISLEIAVIMWANIAIVLYDAVSSPLVDAGP